MEAVKELVSQSVSLHIAFIVLALIVIIRVLFLFAKNYDMVAFGKIYERWVLFYRALLSALIFSGLVVMAIEKFDVRWQVWLMVALAVALLGLTIKENLLYHNTTYLNSSENERFFHFAKRVYKFALSLIILISLISLIK
jgi:branched-subunit amino acid transport protein